MFLVPVSKYRNAQFDRREESNEGRESWNRPAVDQKLQRNEMSATTRITRTFLRLTSCPRFDARVQPSPYVARDDCGPNWALCDVMMYPVVVALKTDGGNTVPFVTGFAPSFNNILIHSVCYDRESAGFRISKQTCYHTKSSTVEMMPPAPAATNDAPGCCSKMFGMRRPFEAHA